MMLSYPLYNLAVSVAAPMAKLYLRAQPRYKPLLARFQPPSADFEQPPLWLQACSVGEVNAARPFLRALQERLPGTPLLLTASTLAGHHYAATLVEGAQVAWFPADSRRTVRRFLAAVQPRALVLVEAELWPNVLRETRRAGAPVLLVNGRISEKHFARLLRWQRWTRPMFRQISAAGMQSSLYAERIVRLGVPESQVSVTGNVKFDAVDTEIDPRVRTRLRTQLRIPADAPLLVFGSTRPGDEALALACWNALRPRWPKLRLLIAPRHLHRIDEVLASLQAVPHVRRSAMNHVATAADAPVVVLDTVGELAACYALATLAVIGGSFYPDVNGHNPLEPAALGVPVVFGPHMANFQDPADILLASEAAVQVPAEGLADALGALLADSGACRRLGTRARKAVLDNRGAVDNNVELVMRCLAASGQAAG